MEHSEGDYDVECYSSILDIGENLKQFVGSSSSRWDFDSQEKSSGMEKFDLSLTGI
ncbi:MAG: hypothetical protein ACOC38_12240 [Promethearchaeia archaeon]